MAAQNNSHLLFCTVSVGQESNSYLAVVLAQSLSWGCTQVISHRCSHLKAPVELKHPFPTHAQVWLQALFSLLAFAGGFSSVPREPFHREAHRLVLPRASDPREGTLGKRLVFFNLSLDVTCHIFSHVHMFTRTALGTVREKTTGICTYMEQASLRAILKITVTATKF